MQQSNNQSHKKIKINLAFEFDKIKYSFNREKRAEIDMPFIIDNSKLYHQRQILENIMKNLNNDFILQEVIIL